MIGKRVVCTGTWSVSIATNCAIGGCAILYVCMAKKVGYHAGAGNVTTKQLVVHTSGCPVRSQSKACTTNCSRPHRSSQSIPSPTKKGQVLHRWGKRSKNQVSWWCNPLSKPNLSWEWGASPAAYSETWFFQGTRVPSALTPKRSLLTVLRTTHHLQTTPTRLFNHPAPRALCGRETPA
jgi:hypothetical protein